MSWLDGGKPFTGTEPWLVLRAILLVGHWRKCLDCSASMPVPIPMFVHQRTPRMLQIAEIGRRVHMSATGARMRYYALTGRERPDRAK